MSRATGRFTSKACEELKHYVYLYIDPRTNRPFYVGKGKGNRCFSHLRALKASEKKGSKKKRSEKTNLIEELLALGLKPRIELLKYGRSEEDALLVEATAIDLLNIANLTNAVRGFGARVGSRGNVESIAAELSARDVTITHPAMLININKLFRHDMTLHELYDATRSSWMVGPKRENAKYALSVYRGVVREVFWIEKWIPAGTTIKLRDSNGRPPRGRAGRWEFVGRVAEDAVRRKYLNRSVREYFKPGAQNPIQYVNC